MEYKNPKKGPLPITLSNGVTETFSSRDWIYIEDSVATSSPMLLNAFKKGKLLRKFDVKLTPEKIETPSLDKTVFVANIIKIEKPSEKSSESEEKIIAPIEEVLNVKRKGRTKTKKSEEF